MPMKLSVTVVLAILCLIIGAGYLRYRSLSPTVAAPTSTNPPPTPDTPPIGSISLTAVIPPAELTNLFSYGAAVQRWNDVIEQTTAAIARTTNSDQRAQFAAYLAWFKTELEIADNRQRIESAILTSRHLTSTNHP